MTYDIAWYAVVTAARDLLTFVIYSILVPAAAVLGKWGGENDAAAAP